MEWMENHRHSPPSGEAKEAAQPPPVTVTPGGSSILARAKHLQELAVIQKKALKDAAMTNNVTPPPTPHSVLLDELNMCHGMLNDLSQVSLPAGSPLYDAIREDLNSTAARIAKYRSMILAENHGRDKK